MPFISLFKRKAVEKKKDTDGDHNRENSEKKNKEQQSRNFLKDAEGLFPHEILLLSYYEKYSAGKPIARFWKYEFGIEDVPTLMRSLEERGFAKNGKLTERGLAETKTGEYISYMRRHKYANISISNMSILVNKHPKMNYKDLLWGEFNRLSNEYIVQKKYGLYRNTRFYMYELLKEEKKYEQALQCLAEVVFYDLNGSVKSFMPQGIVESIRELSRLLDWPEEKLIDCLREGYREMYSPYHNYSPDEATCVVAAFAYGYDEMAQELFMKKKTDFR